MHAAPTIRGKRHAYHKRTPVYCVASFACLPVVPGRFVGAACMQPASLPPPPVAGVIDAVPSVCRGGIYASRQGCAIERGLRDNRPYTPLCRAGVHARRTLKNLKIIMCGGVKTPHYNTKQTACTPINTQRPHRFAGGMYAAPTHGPNAVATQKPCYEANGHGPHACGPYKAK